MDEENTIEEKKLVTDGYEMIPADPQEIPEPTFWPIVLGFAVLFLFWGLITSWIISAVGIVMTAISIAGWIIELNHEENEHTGQ